MRVSQRRQAADARAEATRSGLARLLETSQQAEESSKLASKWIDDEHFSTVIPSAPKITSGKVVARSNAVTVS